MVVLDDEHSHETVLVAGGAGVAGGMALVVVGDGLGGNFMNSYFLTPRQIRRQSSTIWSTAFILVNRIQIPRHVFQHLKAKQEQNPPNPPFFLDDSGNGLRRRSDRMCDRIFLKRRDKKRADIVRGFLGQFEDQRRLARHLNRICAKARQLV